MQQRTRQTDIELENFMSALDQVEQAGGALHRLPRARLLEIQRVLREGVSGTFEPMLPPTLSQLLPTAPAAPPAAPPAAQKKRMGLAEEELEQLGSHVMPASTQCSQCEDEESPCAICLSELQPGETVISLACCHSFHAKCAKRWLELSPLCPLCKQHALGKSVEAQADASMHSTGAATSPGDDDTSDLLQAAASAIGASRAASITALVGGTANARGYLAQRSRPPRPAPRPRPMLPSATQPLQVQASGISLSADAAVGHARRDANMNHTRPPGCGGFAGAAPRRYR